MLKLFCTFSSMFPRLEIILVAVLTTVCLAQEKWVWSDKTAKAVRDGDRVRYGIVEPDDGFRPPPQGRPPPDFPPLIRPPPSNFPQPPSRPESDPTRFEKCRCVHSFNCKSPGLLFGSCDTGKKYCCEKSMHSGATKDFLPDLHEPQVLAGPGGPIDHIRKQNTENPVLGRPYGRPSGGGIGRYGTHPGPRY